MIISKREFAVSLFGLFLCGYSVCLRQSHIINHVKMITVHEFVKYRSGLNGINPGLPKAHSEIGGGK